VRDLSYTVVTMLVIEVVLCEAKDEAEERVEHRASTNSFHS
jgi:hypothetical protein